MVLRINPTVIAKAPALAHNPDCPATLLAHALTGENATHRVAFAAEAGLFQAAGLPTVLCGPGSIDQAHQPNEYISLEQIEAGTAFIRRLIARLS